MASFVRRRSVAGRLGARTPKPALTLARKSNMARAAKKAITNKSKKNPHAALTADIELTPERCEYIAADKVRVTLKRDAGDPVTYTVTTASMMKSVNLSMALINGFTVQVLRDLDVL
jgi:hypothetical protein